VLNDVQSNVGLGAMRYLPYINNMDASSITTFTMPGRPAYVSGVSWFLADPQMVPEVVGQIFYAEINHEADLQAE